MTNSCGGFARRLVAALLALQLAAGVAVCKAWEGSAESRRATVAGENHPSPATGDHGGEDHSHSHSHADGGHHDCPETCLAPANRNLAPRTASRRLRADPPGLGPTRGYDVPPPVPILRSPLQPGTIDFHETRLEVPT